MKKEDQHLDKELKRAVSKAIRRTEKMISEEPHRIVIESDGKISSNTISEIEAWLFKRRQGQ